MLNLKRSSFRYEVKVTTPHFQIATMDECDNRKSLFLDNNKLPSKYLSWFGQKLPRSMIPPVKPVALLGFSDSRSGTLCLPESLALNENYYTVSGKPSNEREEALARMGMGEDMSSWFYLLEDVHRVQRSVGTYFELCHPPAMSGSSAKICISSKSSKNNTCAKWKAEPISLSI